MPPIRKVVKTRLEQYAPAPDKTPAWLGDAEGTINVPERPNYVYARDINGGLLQVWNGRVQNRPGLPIWIGIQDGRLQIIGSRDVYPEPAGPDIPQHANTHEWGDNGSDVIRTWAEQWMPLKVEPAGGLDVRIYRAMLYNPDAAAWVEVVDQDVDLTSSQPTTGARFALLSVDQTDGTISVTDGTPVDSTEDLELDDIPAVPAGHYPLAAVRLYDGQDDIAQGTDNTDIIDLRLFNFAGSSGAGTGDMHKSVYDTDNDGVVDDSESTQALRNNEIDPDLAPADGEVLAWNDYTEQYESTPVDVPDASDANPEDIGATSPGISDDYSRADHVHGGGSSGGGSNSVCDGRLTLTDGTPVTTDDSLTAKTEIFLNPYLGDQISLWNGAAYEPLEFTNPSLKLTDVQDGTTTNGAPEVTGLTDTSQMVIGLQVTGTNIPASTTIASVDSSTQITLDKNATGSGEVELTFKVPPSTNLDVAAVEASGAVALRMRLWASANARATALTRHKGVLIPTGYTEERFLGMARTTSVAGQTEEVRYATTGAANRFLYNYYNRKIRPGFAWNPGGGAATNPGATWREWNSGTHIVRYWFLQGVIEQGGVVAPYYFTTPNAGVTGYFSIGINQTTASGLCQGRYSSAGLVSLQGAASAKQTTFLEGLNYMTILEYSSGIITTNQYSLFVDIGHEG